MSSSAGRADFVERMGSAIAAVGFPRLSARIFAALLVDEDGRMTAAELAERLDVSPAAISGAVRHLEAVTMLRRERERGSRRDVFVVEDDAWYGTMTRADRTYAPLIAALERAITDLDPDDPALRRLRLSREFLVFLLTEMQTLEERWRIRMRELGLDQ
jgi:DNA-binding transcriptional regulator GbsR (MarR family)